MAALVEEIEPANGLLNRFANGQQPMIAKECRAVVAESVGNVITFVFGQDDAFAFEDDVILLLSANDFILS